MAARQNARQNNQPQGEVGQSVDLQALMKDFGFRWLTGCLPNCLTGILALAKDPSLVEAVATDWRCYHDVVHSPIYDALEKQLLACTTKMLRVLEKVAEVPRDVLIAVTPETARFGSCTGHVRSQGKLLQVRITFIKSGKIKRQTLNLSDGVFFVDDNRALFEALRALLLQLNKKLQLRKSIASDDEDECASDLRNLNSQTQEIRELWHDVTDLMENNAEYTFNVCGHLECPVPQTYEEVQAFANLYYVKRDEMVQPQQPVSQETYPFAKVVSVRRRPVQDKPDGMSRTQWTKRRRIERGLGDPNETNYKFLFGGKITRDPSAKYGSTTKSCSHKRSSTKRQVTQVTYTLTLVQ
jgi:hypothetical protein